MARVDEARQLYHTARQLAAGCREWKQREPAMDEVRGTRLCNHLAGNRCQLYCRGAFSSDRPCQVQHHCSHWKEVKRLFAAFAAAATGTFDPAADTYEGWRGAGLLTQGDQGPPWPGDPIGFLPASH